MTDELVAAIVEMRDGDALALTKQRLDDDANPLTILDECRAAMEIVGKRFEVGEYFLPELILAGEMMKQIAAQVKPRLQSPSAAQKRAKVIIGTVQGDIHDIGKDIVALMLDINGFEVHDLGVDVPPEKFVEQIAILQPQVVALSGLLTIIFDSMKETIAAIQAAGLRERVKIMIGGGTVDEQVRGYVGADAYGKDAIAAVALAKAWEHDHVA